MRINNNVMAFNAYRNLNQTGGSLGKSLERLSSGLRINRAGDDAAGLVKSEQLRAEINGSRQAQRNAQDGISLVQTAEGALNEVSTILQRMRDLAVSAGNEATSDGTAEEAEIDQLLAEIDNIGTNTSFAGDQVFSGDDAIFQIGAGDGQTLSVNIASLTSASVGTDTIDLNTLGASVAGTTAARSEAIAAIDSAIASVSSQRSTLGASQNRMESTIRNLGVATENLTAAESRIRDTDMAAEMVSFTRNQILQQAGTSMLAQANAVPQSVLSLLG